MCGICGIINQDKEIDQATLKRMTRVLAHRGPDGEGIHLADKVGLGHRRLSVIDLSDNARQPMLNEDGSIALVFNGMIYNYRELSAELKARGHRFISNSDTEVIIHLYEESGLEFVSRLRGMFALAIWDGKRRQLVLARDRIGEKPLVYAQVGGTFMFASETKSLLVSGLIRPEVDPVGVHYLFNYRNVPYPHTMFRGIKKLPPASLMVVKDGKPEIHKYWKPDMSHKLKLSPAEAAERLYGLINDSVKTRLISDVPVGAFLSGGVDSSLIATMISKNADKKLKAFSVGFEGGGIKDEEFLYAGIVARRYGMEHHKITVGLDILDEIKKVVWHYDEPFAIPEAMINMSFCREVKKKVTIALTGDGSDEMFAGYSGYLKWKFLGDFDFFLRSEHASAKLLSACLGFFAGRFPSPALKMLTLPAGSKRAYAKGLHAEVIENLIYSRKLKGLVDTSQIEIPLKELYSEVSPGHLLDGVLFMDLVLNDSHSTCVFSDISGMANGLEIRSPFLDHNVVEFAAALPVNMKIRGVERKYILKLLAEPLIPREILHRKKSGYGGTIPLRPWFKNVWKDRIEKALFDEDWDKEGFFDKEAVKKLWDSHISGRGYHFDVLWTLFCYSVWHKIFFEEFNQWTKEDLE